MTKTPWQLIAEGMMELVKLRAISVREVVNAWKDGLITPQAKDFILAELINNASLVYGRAISKEDALKEWGKSGLHALVEHDFFSEE